MTMMLLRAPTHRLALLLGVAAALLLVQDAAAFRLFGRTKSAARAAGPMRPKSTAAGDAPAPSKGAVSRLLDKLNPLRIKDYE
jgi:hypothetical protein